jgi:hypothetical protein
MRILHWMVLAGTMLAVAPATGQRYDPDYPVCLQRWEWGGSSTIYCRFTSWDQCRMATVGFSAMCLTNPYWPQARPTPARRLPRGKARLAQ